MDGNSLSKGSRHSVFGSKRVREEMGNLEYTTMSLLTGPNPPLTVYNPSTRTVYHSYTPHKQLTPLPSVGETPLRLQNRLLPHLLLPPLFCSPMSYSTTLVSHIRFLHDPFLVPRTSRSSPVTGPFNHSSLKIFPINTGQDVYDSVLNNYEH